MISKVLNNERGVAIIMVTSAIAIIIPVVLYFTLDSATNKIKASNIEDRARARLTAESAIKFAMARLTLYKEAYNFLQKNSGAKELVKQEQLDLIWNFPFVYPIPLSNAANMIQKDAIKKFHEDNILHGGFNLTINNISNKINLNLLRISLMAQANQKNNELNEQNDGEEDNDDEASEFNIESQLIKALTNSIESESQKDELFNAKYFGLEVEPLVNELKYFISDPDAIEDTAGAESGFSEKEISPKSAPLISSNELFTLPGWPDAITNLLRNEFTVHGAIMIDLNKITDKLLKLLIPDILDEDVEEFFKYKDDPDDPKYFNSLDDFKNYIVKIGNLMSEDDFNERFGKFQKEGLVFGQTPTLFKIVCYATVGRSTFNITAYVTIPAKPAARPKNDLESKEEPEKAENNDKEKDKDPNSPEDGNNSTDTADDKKEDEKKEEIIELLNPRIVEIIIG